MNVTTGTLQDAVIAGLLACAATGVGGIPVTALGVLTERMKAASMAFGGGVMLAATCFSLILPGLENGQEVFRSKLISAIVCSVGVIIGALGISVLERFPIEKIIRLSPQQDSGNIGEKRIWAFILAITLHNFPEGLAIGVAYGGDVDNARKLATAIAIQDIPEGAVIAVLLLSLGWNRYSAFLGALLSGIAEPIAAIIGKSSVDISRYALPFGMSLAAGAMLFVVVDQIIPEAKDVLKGIRASVIFIGGFLLMLLLDVLM